MSLCGYKDMGVGGAHCGGGGVLRDCEDGRDVNVGRYRDGRMIKWL